MRYTKTKLEKIVEQGLSRMDRITEKCCDDLELLKKKPESRQLEHEMYLMGIAAMQAKLFDSIDVNQLYDTSRLMMPHDIARSQQVKVSNEAGLCDRNWISAGRIPASMSTIDAFKAGFQI